MNLAIVDDDRLDRQRINSLLKECLEECRAAADCSLFPSAEAFLSKWSPGAYDIVFLDLYMKQMGGMALAEKIREQGDSCLIVFITNSTEGAVSGYEVSATAYLVKPVSKNDLGRTLKRCLERLGAVRQYIDVVSNRMPVRIPLASMLWVNTFRNSVLIHTTGGESKVYMTFGELKQLLQDTDKKGRFLECYKGCLVNMDMINSVTDNGFALKNGEEIQIRRHGESQIRNSYFQYLLNSNQGD